ncbi:MAG TPA: BrnT family toxin [Deltaproteobacteria bacterium]|nr:BrnT family toxin [Deltaproteobacteria bacterium]
MIYDPSVNFEWDDRKNLINEQKHGVSFEEACRLFESKVNYLEIFDSEHSDFEDRFIAIGPIVRGLIVVIYTEKEGDIIRIIGARLANKNEQSLYRSYMDRYR